mgnify:CR=1 FL=1
MKSRQANTVVNRHELVSNLRQHLESMVGRTRKIEHERVFKEAIRTRGLSLLDVRRVAREFGKSLRGMDKAAVFACCEELWLTGQFEESMTACHWSLYPRNEYRPSDIRVFERWIRQYVDNWAACDTFCNHTVATLLEMYPETMTELKRWARSKNRWLRRGAATSLIVPAKKGLFLEDILEIARILLDDKDDLVQKGYGWMLKVAWGAHPEALHAFVMNYRHRMPRTALRYAIEKWPPGQRAEAMDRL